MVLRTTPALVDVRLMVSHGSCPAYCKENLDGCVSVYGVTVCERCEPRRDADVLDVCGRE